MFFASILEYALTYKIKKSSLTAAFFILALCYSKDFIAFLIISIASRNSSSVITNGGAKRIIC